MTGLKQIVAATILLFAMSNAWAIGIAEAKAKGLVGESNTGYLMAVQEPASADVKALVASVNAKRKAQFEQTARKTDTTMAQVSNRFYELAVQRTKPGHYYQDKRGQWKKK